ncbi:MULTISPECIES: hypothetical protein [unclassified Mycobacterium]|uniref:hypothetical protein n=1 Tax=unclassified Mycobacterium TaxID=2642494 RepID=UPI000800DC95|nr:MULTISPECIES: hypothetical protein [unclassified Mycobacterium]OBH01241.1 hypothetical protein A5696_13845 [Mycobacterium sp. E2699]OBI49553.1 hypothetical protein A5705_13035 [Mycobacterium sp. E787]
MLSLFIAVIGLVFLALGPIRYTGMTLVLTLLTTLGITVFDMSTHQPTSTDITGFALALMLGGPALLVRSERGMRG